MVELLILSGKFINQIELQKTSISIDKIVDNLFPNLKRIQIKNISSVKFLIPLI